MVKVKKDSDKIVCINKELLNKHFKDIEDFIEDTLESVEISSSWIKDIQQRNSDILNGTINLRDRRWGYL
jgi:inorganic pyrophosphatase